MLLVSSRLSSFVAAPRLAAQGSPYPEVTDALLPSSLTQDDPFALVYSTTPPVLDCGTVSHSSRMRRFSWKQKGTDSVRQRRSDWGKRSTHPRDLPPGINALRFPRAVNAHALIFPLRHAAPRLETSFPTDISPEGDRGRSNSQRPPLNDLYEVQEY